MGAVLDVSWEVRGSMARRNRSWFKVSMAKGNELQSGKVVSKCNEIRFRVRVSLW